jgi:hypothetical protein
MISFSPKFKVKRFNLQYPRSATGQTSLAYVIVNVWNTPHGIPHKISATNKCTTVCAVKKIAVNAIISSKHAMTVYLYPIASLTQPFKNNPMISPTMTPLLSPACHFAGISYVPSGSCEPYLRLNCGNPKKLFNRQTS